MRRKLFTLCSGVSLSLCVAVCVLWVRSRSEIDVAHWAGQVDAALVQTCEHFYSAEGAMCLSHTRCEHDAGPVTDLMAGGFQSFPVSMPLTSRPFSGFALTAQRPLGFGFARDVIVDPPTGPWQRRWTHWAVSVPYWFVALLTVALPARWCADRVTRRQRGRAGLCLACGYDLRATPQRCPECGATPESPHNPPMQRTATASSGAVE